MPEYIEREVLDKSQSICSSCFHSYVCEQFNGHRGDNNEKCHFHNDHFVPAADVAEVVRCRNCKYHHWEQEPCHGKTEHFCSVLNAQVFKDFYCYHGAKMDGKGEG